MGINKEELHKDLIGIFEGEDTDLKDAKNKIGTVLSTLKKIVDSQLQDFLDATPDLSVKEMEDLIKSYGANSTAKAMLIAAIKEINE